MRRPQPLSCAAVGHAGGKTVAGVERLNERNRSDGKKWKQQLLFVYMTAFIAMMVSK